MWHEKFKKNYNFKDLVHSKHYQPLHQLFMLIFYSKSFIEIIFMVCVTLYLTSSAVSNFFAFSVDFIFGNWKQPHGVGSGK